MQNPQQKEPFQDLRAGLNIFGLLVNSYATAIVPFFHKDFGIEYFGINALVAVFIMIFYGAFQNAPEMLRYLVVWLVVVAAHRMDSFRLQRKGRIVHSQYSGTPWIARKLPFVRKDSTARQFVEPMMCLFAGMLFCPLSQGIGGFLIVGSFALMMSGGLQRAAMKRRVQQMRDAYIEQQATSRMFRGIDDDL